MHAQAYHYVAGAVAALGGPPTRVLEIGSYDVNGSVRPLFAGAERYHGIDIRPGPGVDEVADAATYRTNRRFDVVVCCETLEHAPDPAAVIQTAYDLLTPGGHLILTAAAHDRMPHGVNGGMVQPGEHYANIHEGDLRAWLGAWESVSVLVANGDIAAVARKTA